MEYAVSILKNLMFYPNACQPQASAHLGLEINLVHNVCVCSYMSVSNPEASTTSGMIWCNMNPIQLVKQVLWLLYGSCIQYY